MTISGESSPELDASGGRSAIFAALAGLARRSRELLWFLPAMVAGSWLGSYGTKTP